MTTDQLNGHRSISRQHAEDLIRRGIMPLPVPIGSKNAGAILGEGWQDQRLYTDYHMDVFDKQVNIGMRLGHIVGPDDEVLTNRFADADLDIMEAVRAAPFFLPKTGMIWGRSGKPMSHWGYRIRTLEGTRSHKEWNDPLQTKGDDNPDGQKAKIAELRFNGHTLAPGSINTQDGYQDQVRWYEDGNPTELEWAELERALAWTCAAGLLGRYWVEGVRHNWSGPLAGMLARGGVSRKRAETFQRAICAAAREDELATENRVRYVLDTYDKIAKGEKEISGRPTLEEAGCDPKLTAAVRAWLQLKSANGNDDTATRTILSRRLSQVEPRRVHWAVEGYIPLAMLTLCAAPGEAGKTHVNDDFMVRLAGGYAMPDGLVSGFDGPVVVAVLTTENPAEEIMQPSMLATAQLLFGRQQDKINACLDNILIVDGVEIETEEGSGLSVLQVLSFPQDLNMLKAWVRQNNVKVLFFDPLLSFTDGAVKQIDAGSVRKFLDPLARLAREEDVAIVAVVHFSKRTEGDFIDRISGSHQFKDAARSVYTVLSEGRNQDGEIKRWIASAKLNVGPTPNALAFVIESVPHPTFQGERTTVVTWLRYEHKRVRAEDLDAEFKANRDATKTKSGLARVELMKRLLMLWVDGKRVVTSKELEDWREEVDVAKETWSSAKKSVGMTAESTGKGKGWIVDLRKLEMFAGFGEAGSTDSPKTMIDLGGTGVEQEGCE